MSTALNPRLRTIHARHFSTSGIQRIRPPVSPTDLHSSSIQALDLSRSRVNLPAALASLRAHVLSYLSDLETRLALLDFKAHGIESVAKPTPPDSSADPNDDYEEEEYDPDELDLNSEDVAAFINRGFELLWTIRAEVCSYLPDDFDLKMSSSAALHSDSLCVRFNEFGMRPYIPQMLAEKIHEFEFEMPSMPTMPSMDTLRSRLSEISSGGVSPVKYVPRLQEHLARLQAHMQDLPFSVASTSTFPLPSTITLPKVVTDILADLLEEDTEEAILADIKKAKEEEENMHVQVQRALRKSDNGCKLIIFDDLPRKWRNNEHVRTGYRFIPASSWPALVFSIFELHNETANIHTHLIPLISLLPLAAPFLVGRLIPTSFASLIDYYSSHVSIWLPTLIPSNPLLDTLPSMFFTLSAACCLLSSCIWHIFSGCSYDVVVEGAARGDYVGIGWLISASVQSIIFYGFKCQPVPLRMYTVLTVLTGLAGSIVPFQAWFNERRNKKWRIVFFLGLCFASLLPLTHLAIAKGPVSTLWFVLPTAPSCALYIVGLCFYATHFPENRFPGCFDFFNSHSLWHVCIVLAIRAHYVGLGYLLESSASFSCASPVVGGGLGSAAQDAGILFESIF